MRVIHRGRQRGWSLAAGVAVNLPTSAYSGDAAPLLATMIPNLRRPLEVIWPDGLGGWVGEVDAIVRYDLTGGGFAQVQALGLVVSISNAGRSLDYAATRLAFSGGDEVTRGWAVVGSFYTMLYDGISDSAVELGGVRGGLTASLYVPLQDDQVMAALVVGRRLD
jgi:hypothetical protein